MPTTVSYGLRRSSPQATAVTGRRVSVPVVSGLSRLTAPVAPSVQDQAPKAELEENSPLQQAKVYATDRDVKGGDPFAVGPPYANSPTNALAMRLAGFAPADIVNYGLGLAMMPVSPATAVLGIGDLMAKASNTQYAQDRLQGILNRSAMTSGLINQDNQAQLFNRTPSSDLQNIGLEASDPMAAADVGQLSTTMKKANLGPYLSRVPIRGLVLANTVYNRLAGNYPDEMADTEFSRPTNWTGKELMGDSNPDPKTGIDRDPTAMGINAINEERNAIGLQRNTVKNQQYARNYEQAQARAAAGNQGGADVGLSDKDVGDLSQAYKEAEPGQDQLPGILGIDLDYNPYSPTSQRGGDGGGFGPNGDYGGYPAGASDMFGGDDDGSYA